MSASTRWAVEKQGYVTGIKRKIGSNHRFQPACSTDRDKLEAMHLIGLTLSVGSRKRPLFRRHPRAAWR